MKALEVKHIPATMQIADVFTKSLSQESFFKWCNKLDVSVLSTPSLKGSKGHTNIGPLYKAQMEEMKKTVLSLSASEKQESKQLLREHGTNMPAHCVTTKNRFECLDSCAVVGRA